MTVNFRINQYKKTAVTTSSKGKILIMLYEAAIQNVKMASLAIERKNISSKGAAIGKTHDIINELLNTLDFEVGGKIAKDLEKLYNFITEQLIKANLENSEKPLETVRRILETLLEGWRGAVEQLSK